MASTNLSDHASDRSSRYSLLATAQPNVCTVTHSRVARAACSNLYLSAAGRLIDQKMYGWKTEFVHLRHSLVSAHTVTFRHY